jgi:hypothetical protein
MGQSGRTGKREGWLVSWEVIKGVSEDSKCSRERAERIYLHFTLATSKARLLRAYLCLRLWGHYGNTTL